MIGRSGIWALAAGCLVLAASPPEEAALPELPKGVLTQTEGLASIISLDEISRGQRGYGLSVFAGHETERFEVEVLGVLRDFSPQSSAIIARLTGQGLEQSGVIAGMSGSPVYIDGRLAGAVAFGWNYSKEAIAGITPIEAMRQLATEKALPGSAGTAAWASSTMTYRDLLQAELPQDLLARELSRLRPKTVDHGTAGVVWSVGGFGPTSRQLLEGALGAVASAGSMRPIDATLHGSGGATSLDLSLPPGSPVAAALIRGDLQLAATGTVTDRFGDKVLAFGHPFLGFGPVSLPMAVAEVITVISSTANSFKLSNLGPVVGAFEQDRQVGIFGRLHAKAPTVPFTLSISGEGIAEPREFHMELAELRQMLPTLLAVATLGSLDSAGHASGPQSLDLTATFSLRDFGELKIDQSFDGENAGNQAAIYLLTFGALAFQTPLEDVHVEGVEVSLKRKSGVRLARIMNAHPDRTIVGPGETVRVFLDLVHFGGERERRKLDIEVPKDLATGSYYLMIGDGVSSDTARFTIEPGVPEDYRQQLRLLRSLSSRRDLVILGLVAAEGLTLEGEVMPQLPGSIRSLWSAASPGSVQSLNLAIAYQESRRQEIPMEGMVRVDLEVRRP